MLSLDNNVLAIDDFGREVKLSPKVLSDSDKKSLELARLKRERKQKKKTDHGK